MRLRDWVRFPFSYKAVMPNGIGIQFIKVPEGRLFGRKNETAHAHQVP
ncbi:MAG: hypothetical protein MUE81_17255 [Thermoflexibacter sp.]|nr:hypothetical protein [Thermoflexibacter sp.]